MIINVYIEADNCKFGVELNENYYADNTWKRTSGSSSSCPNKGTWKIGGNFNYLYLNDQQGNNILYLSIPKIFGQGQFVEGKNGLGEFSASSGAIAKSMLISWRVTKVTNEYLPSIF